MRICRAFRIAALVLLPLVVCSQQHSLSLSPGASADGPVLTAALQQKVASGRLLRDVSQHYTVARTKGLSVSQSTMMTAVYASEPPTASFLAELERRGVHALPDTWIPPLKNHQFGFFLAQMPPDKLADVLSLANVKKMDSAESESMPMNNRAAHEIGADRAWLDGWSGTGVKVGVLDSGLDMSFAGTDLPGTITAIDYSSYPTLDNTVNNTVTGHGTHVTGTILGRGLLSAGNTGNGGGAYKGMAPGASLVFLKIGLDGSGSAYDAAEIAAIHAAADVYHVNVLNLSYGGWDDYHDGSNPVSQAIDYAYSQGVACFVAAGNMGGAARHASGSVPPSGVSDYIPVVVQYSGTSTLLKFNLVWSDGAARNNLTLEYFDASHNPITTVARGSTYESDRGTESQYSYDYMFLPNRDSELYYVRVVNPSSVTQQFHLYEAYGNGRVTFVNPDPNYTICSPGDADHAFTVGAYNSRDTWTAMDGSVYGNVTGTENLSSFTSRGPTVTGEMKPNITAPGSKLISLRDHDAYSSATPYCIDNDGILTVGDANYIVMEGTSMAAPVCTGAAAILYQHSPAATPQQIYDAIMNNALIDDNTGTVPNPAWGFGKLDVYAAANSIPLPVEMTSFTYSVKNGAVALAWRTAVEVNNYGFEIEKKEVVNDGAAGGSQSAHAQWTKIGFVAGSGSSNVAHEYAFVDKPTHAGTFAYRLKQLDRDGKFAYSDVVETAAAGVPLEYALSQNFPNPFNPSTTIAFTVAATGRVRVVVYDLLGREVQVLADRSMQPGAYSVQWNAGAVPSGVYFYRLEAGSYSAVKKLLLQK